MENFKITFKKEKMSRGGECVRYHINPLNLVGYINDLDEIVYTNGVKPLEKFVELKAQQIYADKEIEKLEVLIRNLQYDTPSKNLKVEGILGVYDALRDCFFAMDGNYGHERHEVSELNLSSEQLQMINDFKEDYFKVTKSNSAKKVELEHKLSLSLINKVEFDTTAFENAVINEYIETKNGDSK